MERRQPRSPYKYAEDLSIIAVRFSFRVEPRQQLRIAFPARRLSRSMHIHSIVCPAQPDTDPNLRSVGS